MDNFLQLKQITSTLRLLTAETERRVTKKVAGSYAGFPRSRLRQGREFDAAPELSVESLPAMQIGRYVQVGPVDAAGDTHESFFDYAEQVAELNKANPAVEVGEYSFFVPILSAHQSQQMIVGNSPSNCSPRRALQEARKARGSIGYTIQAGLRADEQRATEVLQARLKLMEDNDGIDELAEVFGPLSDDPNCNLDRHRNWGPTVVQLSRQAVKLDDGFSLGFPIRIDPAYRLGTQEVRDAVRMAGYGRGLTSVLASEPESHLRIMSFDRPFEAIRQDVFVPMPPKYVLLGEITIETV